MRVFSFGGGVQSVAALVLAARGELELDTFVFANVGEDSENPATLAYLEQVARPYAASHGVAIEEVRRRRKDGSTETIRQRINRSKSVIIPARVFGRPLPRNCTVDFKIRPIATWCYRHGARATNPATIMLGITTEEWSRANNHSDSTYTRLTYPLLDRRISRADCVQIILSAGLPVPEKSSCYFCPFHTVPVWRELRDKHPEQFAQACELEESLQGRGGMRKPIRLTRFNLPLAQAVQGVQPSLFEDDDMCESGYCMM